MTSLARSPQNDTRLKDLQSEVREFGRLAAQGKDSLPMLAVKIARAAADGVISTQKDADGEDDATRIYAEYLGAMSKKAVHEHTVGGIKANASKLRQIVLASEKTTCDIVDVLRRTFEARQAMEAAKIKVKPAYAAYVDAARTQIGQDDDLSDDQIKEVVAKPEPNEKTIEGELTAIHKKLEALVTGDKGLKDDSPETMEAYQAVERRLAALIVKRKREEYIAKGRDLGFNVELAEAEAELEAAPVTSEVPEEPAPQVDPAAMTNDQLYNELTH